MSVWALRFADGSVFFVGLAAAMLGTCMGARPRRSVLRWARAVLGVAGALLVVLSATPFPWWLYTVWLCLFVAAFAFSNKERRPKSTVALVLVFDLVCVGMALSEMPYHRTPTVPALQANRLCVIGDSLCVGADAPGASWPEHLAAWLDLPLSNFSFGGARLGTSKRNAERPELAGSLAIVEVSGNDVLFGTDPADFRTDLEELLEGVSQKAKHVVLIETPLPPFCNQYGSIQRRLAKTYGATVVPKRYLARVLGTPGATVDGLHLSSKGHELLANALATILKPARR